MSTAVIIPTYNESENLPELVRRIHACTDGSLEILVMDDSPNDTTAYTARKEGCQAVQRGKAKKGLSAAVIDGIRFSDGDKVVVMDADLQHPPEALPRLLEALETYDFVVMSRYVEGGGCRHWDFDRKVVSKIANLAAGPLHPTVKDLVSGFFGFRREGLPKLTSVNTRGFKIMLELLCRGRWRHVTEVPYIFEDRTRGESKLSTGRITDYILQLIPLYLRSTILKFACVGASGAVIGLGSLYLLTEVVGLHYLASYIIAFGLSVTNNWYWNSHWTFGRTIGVTGWTRYATVSAFTLVLNLTLVYALTDWAGLWYMLSATIGTLSAFILNYVLSRRVVWRG